MGAVKDFARHPRGAAQRARADAWLFRQALKLAFQKRAQGDVVEQFHRIYYDGAVFGDTRASTFWLGIRADKCPLDLWIYQELLFEHRPDVVVETGTANGGSTLFFASMFDIIGGDGRVVTIDVDEEFDRPEHERITYVKGSSVAAETLATVRELVGSGTAMVFLDSDHTRDHVLAELRAYQSFVPAGGYLVVEDTNLNGRPVSPDFGPGPGEAVDAFLNETTHFERDRGCEKFYLTFNPGGYLRRTREP
jgi:cephalosporin hydroxylase